MKFLVPNYSCLQNPWLRSYRPRNIFLSVLCPELNLLNPLPPPNKILGYVTGDYKELFLLGRKRSITENNYFASEQSAASIFSVEE